MQRLKYVKALKVEEKLRDFSWNILSPIICIEVDLDQPCSLEQETKDKVVNFAVQCFRYYAQLMDESERISEDPVLVFKQLQSVLIVLLKSNVDPNFLRNDANFAKCIAEKIKPLFIEHFRANGLRFVTWSESEILKRLVMDCLEASESPFFTNEELNKILNCLNNRREYYDL
uniref:Uncharacterized protein n=1 Tax=Romanomermis culicivorax TaxID=13658 RepID=A0A915IBN2_ROMCU